MFNLGQNWHFVVSGDLEIRWMTLKNNRTPLLCDFKLCALFQNHWWNQIGVTVWIRWIWVKIDLSAYVTLKFDGCPHKDNWEPNLCHCKLFHNFVAIGLLELQSQIGGKICFDLCDLDLWRLNLILDMDITFVNGNNSCKFHDDMMMGS